ncbi:maltooligosyl trehalose synthase [Antricoccus suffuscus]|uniref:Maltooligosyl trehalose synthase n=1 Tax=Antricoccus suffuscus TaxID=1629062 RepID=A0A2T0ZYY5_9ACTN|nr:malto-oligosyltrehalose synthase [Antricoccus suffuscus]PRZ41561.1 maltooligosyl trehalose synthase [Antricoccus suffuscus]
MSTETRQSNAPTSTYRLQITSELTLQRAARLVGYLRELGVGAIYVSPLLKATDGSMHGYDVVDHSQIDPSRGGPDGFAELAKASADAGLALVVDIVPNHMGVADAAQNGVWWEFLRMGRESPAARWYDVDYEVADGKVLLPVLGDGFDLDRQLRLYVDNSSDEPRYELHYYQHRFPVAPGTYTEGDTARRVHERQHYRLVNYRRADTDQNYRRFFAVTTLAGLRVEDPSVFDATHAEILRWLRDYGVTGIRVDHPDGLTDPGDYLETLAAQARGAWITVEKITEPGEHLPSSWPVAGTTGYDVLAEVNTLLYDEDASEKMTRIYRDVTADERDWEQHIAEGKRLIATTILQAEIHRVARAVPGVEYAVDALTELAVAFDVYRSYLPLGRERLARAARVAAVRRPELAQAIEALQPWLSDPQTEACARFQQATGAIMAKGVEDTAYYRYSRAIGLNEVGGNPGTFGLSLDDFHAAQRERLQRAPYSMTTLSTHDTKRGEDVRARLAVIPELGDSWAEVASRLAALVPIPNRAFGYLLWQTFAATGLIERDRMHAYAEKAMREAADGTGWIDPDADFERAVHAAVDAAYDDPTVRAIIEDFAARLVPYGLSNSLSQKLIQLTIPGVPDVYQGSELGEDSLVDPDNRRPVDFEAHAEALRAVSSGGALPTLDESGLVKIWVTSRALRARRDLPNLFHTYRPMYADGPGRDHLVAFDRGGAITVATRLPVALGDKWASSTLTLPAAQYIDAMTGLRYEGTIRVADLLDRYPVALLLRREGGA